MIWDRETLRPLANRPWPMEPLALATMVSEGRGAEQLEPPATGPRLATKVRGDVAIIPLEGVVFPWKAEALADSVTHAANDKSVGAIVLAIDSPGGVITGVPEAAEAVFSARGSKPMYAVSTGMVASAAYWIGSAADRIIASPSAYAGSIGVWTMHADLSKMLEQAGVKVTLLSAGKHKVSGNWFEPLSDEAKADIQADVDDAYEGFVEAVAKHRGVSASAVRSGYGEGRVLNAQRAKEAGLVDKVGTLSAVVSQLMGPAPRAPGRAASTLRKRLDLDVA